MSRNDFSLQAVFLDVGQTLLYERPARQTIYADAARARGLEVDDGAMLGLMKAADRDLPERVDGGFRYSDPWFARFIERIFVEQLGLEPAQLAALTDELFATFQSPATFQLFEGAVEFLERAGQRGLTRGVISNWSSRLPQVLAATGLDAHLDFALSSAIEEVEKPDVGIFRRALERAGCSAERAVHCGDHLLRDGLAVQVGMEVVIVDHFKSHPQTKLPRVEDFEQLWTWIEERDR